mgnify:CR=1
IRPRVDGLTLFGSLKYFEIVGREMPQSAANSSIFLIFSWLIVVPGIAPDMLDKRAPYASDNINACKVLGKPTLRKIVIIWLSSKIFSDQKKRPEAW